MRSACAQEHAPSPGLCVRLSAGSRWPWVPAPRRVSAPCECAHAGSARLEPPLSVTPGAERGGPRLPSPSPLPGPPHAPAGSVLRVRHRLCKEARPGAEGRRQTTTSTLPPPALHRLRGGVQANGRPGEELGRGRWYREPTARCLLPAWRRTPAETEARTWEARMPRRPPLPPLCFLASGAQSRAFPGDQRPPFSPP